MVSHNAVGNGLVDVNTILFVVGGPELDDCLVAGFNWHLHRHFNFDGLDNLDLDGFDDDLRFRCATATQYHQRKHD